MTYLELKEYLEENIGIKNHIMFRKFEGPFIPEAVSRGIQKNRLKDISAYVQPRREDELNEMEIIYFMNESKINALRILTEKHIGLDNNWKHSEILDCNVSTTFQKLYKPFDIAYQIIKIKFKWETHPKSVVIGELQNIGNIRLMNERDFDYQNGYEKNVKDNLLILVIKGEDEGQLNLRFIAKASLNLDDAIGYFENITQHLIRRIKNNTINQTDFLKYKGLDYSYRLI